MNQEIWKDVKGYEGIYQVSNKGRIKSLERTINYGNRLYHKKETFMKQVLDKRGYPCVKLNKDNCVKGISFHRIVAQTFIPNPNNKPQVNHKDGNKLNNCVENLEWVTCLENVNHAFEIGLRKRKK